MAVAAATGLVAAAAWSNTARLAESPVVRSGQWLEDVGAELATVGPRPQLLDGPLPFTIVSSFPGRRTSDLDGLVPKLEVTYTAPDSVLTESGGVEPLRAKAIFEQDGGEYAKNGLVAIAGETVARGSELCTTSELRIDQVLGPHPRPRLLELTIRGPATVDLVYVPEPLRLPEPPARVATSSNVQLLLPMDLLGYTQEIKLTIVPAAVGDPVCLASVRFLEVFNQLPGDFDPD